MIQDSLFFKSTVFRSGDIVFEKFSFIIRIIQLFVVIVEVVAV